MSPKDYIYFQRMSKYNPRKNAANSTDNAAYIAYFKLTINNVAKYVLSGKISPKSAKREISDLLDNLKKVKKGDKSVENVTLG
jgi:hypothetical protein